MRFTLLGGAGLALVAATAMFGCGGSSMATTPTSPSGTPAGTTVTADVTITINGMNGSNSFSPNPGTLKAGQTVAWRNADSTSHTATADNGGFNTGTIAPGATSSPITMSAAGTISYHCSIHPSMVGSLSVQ